jgi:hypothetical protein
VAASCDERRAVRVADAEVEGSLGLPGAPALRSWMALPLLLEGDPVGVLIAGREALDSFTDEDLARAKAVAFWAAAALVRLQQIEQLRRYSALLEQVVDVGQRAFEGDAVEAIANRILEGACRVGRYPGGLLVLECPSGRVVSATSGEAFAAALGRAAPPELLSCVARRLPAERAPAVAGALGVEPPADPLLLVPLQTPEGSVGCLVLIDPNGESPEDRLLEAYASRVAAAWRHVSLRSGRS